MTEIEGLKNLGFMYYEGYRREKNLKKAFDYFMQAAEKGDPEAARCVGKLYEDGLAVEKDNEKAFYWYGKAKEHYLELAEKGDADAQYYLGVIYENGEGVEQNYQEAIKWYEMALKKGHESSKIVLKELKIKMEAEKND